MFLTGSPAEIREGSRNGGERYGFSYIVRAGPRPRRDRSVRGEGRRAVEREVTGRQRYTRQQLFLKRPRSRFRSSVA